jgi:integrase
MGAPYGPLFKVLLLTGCRLAEATGMTRAELSEDGAKWKISGERTKNHRTHVVPLSPLAQQIIADTPRMASEFVFSAGERPLTGFSRAKAQLDALMATPAHFTIHDLRRSCASGLQRIGARVEIIEKCLNHLSGSYKGVVGVYQVDPLSDDVAEALQRWATHVAGLVAGQSANVLTLKRKHGKRGV